MNALLDFASAHPFWMWVAVGAVLLAIELPMTTGWLLAPSICAFLMAVLNLLGVHTGWGAQVIIYAVGTIAFTLLFRILRPNLFKHATPDINDRPGSLLGKVGLAVGAFNHGRGRVLVDGAEWDAVVDHGEAPAAGGKVEVVKVIGGARLSVRPV